MRVGRRLDGRERIKQDLAVRQTLIQERPGALHKGQETVAQLCLHRLLAICVNVEMKWISTL